ncbi:DNA-binding protein WhiA [Natranaerobius trueperi]|uniref:Probable cell division protein WhiA n=1 Tax=Natranaerobius trueperi TaxID=759412 RepID=A0A226BXN9_9FIRM|nr:DNA-binding protein WhiA [Natranaerobius trueperi]OWZ83798.1 DNA-binding protein WhiA [Natranaerobius trueperi]
MSFAKSCKNELARLEIKKHCCERSELAAFVHMNGSLTLTDDVTLQLSTENPAIARRIYSLFKDKFHKDMQILMRKGIRLQKTNSYALKLTGKDKVIHILSSLGITEGGFQITKGINKDMIKTRCCKRAYLRGAFLAKGSVVNPDSSYHLEITADYEEYLDDLVNVMEKFEIQPGKITRKKEYVVYLKDSEQICEFINVIGAHKTLLDYENVRVMKGMRNKINRLVNCETANLQKTVVASLRHINNIKTIDEKLGLSNLPSNLQEIAFKRVEYPEANLKELGELLEPPVGKSGVNHRLRKIEKLAERLDQKQPH